jgi:hypothetical protein
MKSMRVVLLLLILLLLVLYRPLGVWAKLREMWARRDYVLGVFVFAIVVYLLYGLYSMYTQGWFD